MDSKLPNSKADGFTLVELLLVMSIISMLLLMGVGGFISMRNTQQLEQYSQTVFSEVRNQHRSSLLYNRELGETWVWGNIVDVTGMTSGENPPEVRIYKYCALAFGDFETYPKEGTPLPVEASNKDDSGSGRCNGTRALVLINKLDISFTIGEVQAITDSGHEPAYIVFETLSGKVHYYDAAGTELDSTSAFNILFSNKTAAEKLIRYEPATSSFNFLNINSNDVLSEEVPGEVIFTPPTNIVVNERTSPERKELTGSSNFGDMEVMPSEEDDVSDETPLDSTEGNTNADPTGS